MKRIILPILILIRLLTNDGFFNENRNIKIKQQPPEVRSAIRRTWRRGKKMYNYKIKKIERIIDGDTVDVSIDLGFNLTTVQRVRLKGIDAAETRTKDLTEKAQGLVAKAWLEKELSREGEWVIETTKEDKYGRILGTLYLVGDPVTVNERMLNEGIAEPYSG
jgi:micrococcal nuclease